MAEEYDPAVYDAEDDAPPALQAVKYRAFRAELSAVLLRFEKASDWADYASQLGVASIDTRNTPSSRKSTRFPSGLHTACTGAFLRACTSKRWRSMS
jgi:hypothetical protein